MSTTSLLALLTRWEDALRGGQILSARTLCPEYPHLHHPLQFVIDALLAADNTAETIPPAAPCSEAGTLPAGALGTLQVQTGGNAPPGYEILGELGRGGMGVVYKARHRALNRVVALKMIRCGEHAGAHERARFLSEAELVAAVRHPCIVQVHDFGVHGELPYLVLEYCPGGSLADALSDTLLSSGEAARLLEPVARAVQAAHEMGIIHRDLKPGNVLFAEDGAPKVTDFGLARRIEAGGNLTRSGATVGTPSYMAPEQAEGKKDIGPRADVWALGAILYECVTGRPPFRAATPLDTLMEVVANEPVAPRLLNPHLLPDLEAICLKCLEKDPQRRYAHAGELADDLRRFLDHEPVRARSYNLLTRVARTVVRPSRNETGFRTWASLLLLLAALILVGHLVTFVLIRTSQPVWLDWSTRAGQIVVGLFLLRLYRPSFLPTTSAERQLWSIWLGYFIAYAVSALTGHLLVGLGRSAPGSAAPNAWLQLLSYPSAAIFSGLAFFTMGGIYWGGYYAVGAFFFMVALLMPLHLEWAPLAFGTLWAAVLIASYLHVRRLESMQE